MKPILDQFGRPARLTHRNTYDAGMWSGVSRSTIQSPIADAVTDVSSSYRRETLRKARHLWQNSPTTRGLVERLVTFTIGSGFLPIPASRDSNFNSASKDIWAEFSEEPDIASCNSYPDVQRILGRWCFVDGDQFTLNTYLEGEDGYLPKLQLIESHLCRSKVQKDTEPDGIILNPITRAPSVYEIWPSADESGSPALVDREAIVQFWIPERANQHRGISLLASVVNTCHDVADILALEKAAVKSLCSRKDFIKTQTGELDISEVLRTNGAVPPTIDPEARLAFYKEIIGPETQLLAQGDDLIPWTPNRPTATWEGFMRFLSNSISTAANLPASIVWTESGGGADTRRDLGIASRVVAAWQQTFASKFQKHWNYVMQFAADQGRLTLPVDYRKVVWQTPKDLTIDGGREQAQDRADVFAGLLTLKEYFGRWGLDWKTELDSIGEEQAYVREVAARHGLEPYDIALRDPNLLSKVYAPETPAPNNENLV